MEPVVDVLVRGMAAIVAVGLVVYLALSWVLRRERAAEVKGTLEATCSEAVGLGLWCLEHRALSGQAWAAALLGYIEELHRDVLAAEREAQDARAALSGLFDQLEAAQRRVRELTAQAPEIEQRPGGFVLAAGFTFEDPEPEPVFEVAPAAVREVRNA